MNLQDTGVKKERPDKRHSQRGERGNNLIKNTNHDKCFY